MPELGRVPAVRFANGDRGAVAFQTWGEGETEILVLTEFSTSVDNIWEHPGRTRLLSFYGSLGRVIRFDPRGQGASDPLPLDRLGSIEEWLRDAILVLDETGAGPVAIVAEAFATHVAIALALQNPERVSRLALLNPFARLTSCEGHPFGPSESDVPGIVALIRERWGLGEITGMNVPTLAEGGPDPGFLARSERIGASPMVAAELAEAAYRADIRHLLPDLDLPVLTMYTGDQLYVSREHSQYVAEHIPAASMIEAPSRTFFWGEGSIKAFGEFVRGSPAEVVDRQIASVLFTDIVDSTGVAAQLGSDRWREILDHLDEFVELQIRRHGGRLVKQTGDGHMALFPMPGAAIRAALALLRAAPTLDVQLRAGIHIGDVEHRHDGDIAGIAVHTASRVAGSAGAGELLVSRTVADLLAGSDIELTDRGEFALKGIPGEWRLFSVEPGG